MQTQEFPAPQCLDLRALAAPAPLAQALALAAAEQLQVGARLELLTPQMPYPLIQLLGERGFAVAAERRHDGSAHVVVRRAGGR